MPIDGDTAIVYEEALEKVFYLRQLFPAFYEAHLAQERLTAWTLTGAVFAFLSLIDREFFELEDCMVCDIPRDPLRALAESPREHAGYGDPLLLLLEMQGYLAQPRPVMYGIGIALVLEDDEEPRAHNALTLAIWQLFRETSWALGVNLAEHLAISPIAPDLRDRIAQLPALPHDTDLQALCAQLAMPGQPWSDQISELICYAFGRTNNPMANITNEEIAVMYGDQMDDSWADVKGIAANARAAIALVNLYEAWNAAIMAAPVRQLRALVQALRQAARPASTKPKTLIDVLIDADRLEATVEVLP